MKTLQIIKTSITIFVLALFFLLVGAQCEKDDVPQTQIAKLPPATQTGANTFGCLVDGKAFIPRKGLFNSENQIYAVYDTNTIPVKLVIEASSQKNGDIRFAINGIIVVGNIYQISNDKNSIAEDLPAYTLFNSVEITDDNYFIYPPFSGTLEITKFDEVNQIISGTFWFDATNDKGEKVEVREGRFDMHFIK